MPSPVGHTLFGLGLYIAWRKNLKFLFHEWKLFLWAIICANLPDFDFFVGVAAGNLSEYHQGFTHTLGFALLVWVFTYLTLKFFKSKSAGGISFLSFLLVFSHVFLDVFNNDSRPPVGVRLLWPFSDKYFNWFPVFYPVPHSTLGDIFSSHFINAVFREILVLIIPFLFIVYLKLKKGHEKG